ncbi:MAG: right-handed parallel beta-helix repeat-containing protein [Deltaproteobacteria bacterium]|nr:right-handed parallel beta-helix repeat-containing protein [Deltaproteobacteria bacterium]
MRRVKACSLGAVAVALWRSSALAADPTIAGAITTPYPTVEQLSIEWAITGDDDQDGVVTVRARESGAGAWGTGLPLRRVPAGSNQGFSWALKHSGSLFGLQPDTSYEIELSLNDPDGGSTTQSITARTRRVPAPSANARAVAATPATFAAALSAAQPGDVISLAPGNYAGFTVGRDGTEADPTVIRSEAPGAARVTGDVRIDGRAYVFVEGLTVEGMIKFNNGVGIVVRGCTIRTPRDGVVAYLENTREAYVVDNDIIGPTTWADPNVGANGNNLGEGIQLTGPGHVIAYNRVRGFRDCISTLEDAEAFDQVSVDIANNDLEICADDAIEADFTMGNVRVMRNRISNSFVGISGQPTLGGPAYFIRNVMHNVIYSPFKLHRGSIGDVALHNTVVKCGDALGIYAGAIWSRAFFRNNIFIGGQGGGGYGGYGNGDGAIAQLADADATCSFDYDGFGSIGVAAFRGRIGGQTFNSLTELQTRTTEVHAVGVDLAIFAQAPAFPASGPFPALSSADLRLAAGGAAIDRGVALPSVNDGFAGAAPDLGAYELGEPLPTYGPRTGAPPPADGGPGGDGGPGVDGSVAQDAIGAADGALPGDAGAPSDALGEDGGGGDASAREDAASDAASDARDGAGAGGDAGVVGQDTGTTGGEVSGGCGCAATSSRSRRPGPLAALWLACLLLGVLSARRWRN